MHEVSSRRYLRRSTITLKDIFVAVISGSIGIAIETEPPLALSVALLAALAIDAWSARRAVSGLTINLHGPPEAVAGRTTDWVLQVDGLRRPVVLSPAVEPRLPRLLIDGPEPTILTLAPHPRGVLDHLAFDITATGPIGLYQAGRRVLVPIASPLHVGPQPAPVVLEWPKPRAVGFGLSQTAPLGDDLYRSVRPYQRGDERRRIHWASTAHHGSLMVRESDGTGIVALQVVVDAGPPGYPAEAAISAAAWIAHNAVTRGWYVQLVTLDAPPDVGPIIAPTSPFGPALVARPVSPHHTRLLARRVGTERAISHQLATATGGQLVPPVWAGITCVITPMGVRWE